MKTFFLTCLLLPFFAASQSRTGNLTVFSEDGDLFYLMLNGEKQNREPQNNIRVEELPQPVYNARIVFVDSSRKPISKSLQVADVDEKMMDVTYRLRRDKTGKIKLQAYSAVEVKEVYRVPAGMYVCRFGQKDNTRAVRRNKMGTNPDAVDADPQQLGIMMNVTFNDPAGHRQSSAKSRRSGQSQPSESYSTSSPNNCRGWAMKAADFKLAKQTVMESDFEETKLSTAKSIVAANCLSCDQVMAMCKLLSFEDSRLEFAKYAYPYTIDPKNYFKVNNVFSYDSSKEELNKFAANN